MKVSFDFTADDKWNFEKYVIRTVSKFRLNFILRILNIPVRVFIAFFIGLYFANETFAYYISFIEVLAIALLLSLPLVYYYLYKHKSRHKKMSQGSAHNEMLTIEIDENGIQETTTITKELFSWKGVSRIEQDTVYIYLFVDAIRAYVVPKRAFPSEKESEEFYRAAINYYNINKTNKKA